MEYINAGFNYLLAKSYGWVAIVALGVVIVAVSGFSVGLAKVKKYIRTVGKQEILDAKAKGYTVSEIVDTAVAKTVEKVKAIPSKFSKVIVSLLTSKYILSIIKKNVTKIVHAISEEEVKEVSEQKTAEEK